MKTDLNLSFRIATENDIPLIAALAHEIWHKHYPDIITPDQITYMLEKMYSGQSLSEQMNDGHQFYLVYEKEMPLGFLSVRKEDDGNFFLHKFYIRTENHKKGVGSALFNHVLKQLPKGKIITLTVNRQNYKSVNFYFKHRFYIDQVADFDIGNGYVMNDFVMKKII